MDLQHVIINQLNQIENWQQKKLVVGFSGGLDSTVLLFLLNSINKNFPEIKLSAIHVNHGLMESANFWQSHCENFCNSLKIEFKAITTETIKNSGKGIENAARQARYKAFENHLSKNDLLLLGHHANDQSETIIFRLLRGTGLQGLSGIQAIQNLKSFTVIRPLLTIEQPKIKTIATENNLDWIEDDSNSDEKYDRNFIRKNIIPVLQSRWKDLHQKLSNNALVMSQQSELLNQIAKQDSQKIISESGYLKLSALQKISQSHALNFLSWWFRENLQYSLNSTRLKLISNDLRNFRIEAKFKQNCSNFVLLQSRDRAYLIPQKFFEELECNSMINESLPKKWQPNISVIVSEYLQLNFTFNCENDFNEFRKANLSLKIGIRNSKIKLTHKQHNSEVRKLFQQQNIPSWLKPYWPVLISNDQLITVAGFGHVQNEQFDLDGVTMSCLFCWGNGRHLEI